MKEKSWLGRRSARALPLALLLALLSGAVAPAPAEATTPARAAEPQENEKAQGGEDAGRAALAAAFAEGGVHLDPELGVASIRARVLVRDDLLEYLLVAPGGAAHESLFFTEVQPSLLNAGLLALGVEAGRNAEWRPVEPPPTLEERRAGKPAFDVTPPRGDGFYLYAAWKEDGETFFYRVEDLVANLATSRAMRRHPWVFLGSAFITDRDGSEIFAADVEGNLINVSFFREGHTLLTSALPECVDQSIWVSNAWLVPPRDAEVELVFAKTPLATLPASLEARLPVVVPPPAEGEAR